MEHLERYGFEWENASLQFKYKIKLSTDKKKMKTISMGNGIGKELFLDEQRDTSAELDPSAPAEPNIFVFRSNLLAFFWANSVVQKYFSIGTQTKDFTSLTKTEKNSYIRYYSQWQEIIILKENCIEFLGEKIIGLLYIQF